MRPVFANLRFNQENVLPYVYAINNSLFPGILADYIFVKKSEGALIRRGCQSYDEGVEILQHLAPDIVDRAVTLVHDDAVEKLRRVFDVINYLPGWFYIGGDIFVKWCFLGGFIQILALQNGIHPLDGADIDLGGQWHSG